MVHRPTGVEIRGVAMEHWRLAWHMVPGVAIGLADCAMVNDTALKKLIANDVEVLELQ